MDNVNIDLIRGHMDTIILRTLETNDKYGLEILNEIRDLSQDLYSLKQPTLYNCLKRLEKQGYLSSYSGDTSNGAKRIYYTLTEQGRQFLLEDQRQWEFSRTIIDKLLSDKNFDPTLHVKPFDPSEFRPLTKRQKDSFNDEENKKVEYEKNKNLPSEKTVTQDTKDSLNTSNNLNIMNSPTSQNQNFNSYVHDKKSNNINVNEYQQHYHNESIKKSFNESSVDVNNYIGNKDLIIKNTKPNIEIKDNINYIDTFDSIFKKKKEEKKKQINKNIDNSHINYINEDKFFNMNFEKLKNKLFIDNIKLKVYVKSNTVDYYTGKFYFINKLFRDWSYIIYILFVAFILVAQFASPINSNMKISWSLGFIGISTLLPIISTIIYILNPMQKSRNNFNLSNTLLTGFIFMIGCAVLIVLLAFFAFYVDVTKIETMIAPLIVPLASLILIPMGIVIFAFLFNSKRYHIR